MKNKSWIIILIMGIALTISLGYSIFVSKKANDVQSTVTTTSIIEMTATTATIKNTLTGTGEIEYKELKNVEQENLNVVDNQEGNEHQENIQEENKVYQVNLSINDKDLDKVKEGQRVEIVIKNESQPLNYIGKVSRIDKKLNNQSTITVVIENGNDFIQNQEAFCTVIIEEAINVVALPTEAIQKDGKRSYVQKVKDDGTAEEVTINVGISDDYYVEITEGLKVGDRVQIVKSTTTVTSDSKKANE
mgnify:FL=1|jgi:hypothetical protein